MTCARIRLSALALSVLVLVLPASSAAAPSWLMPTTLSGTRAYSAQVAVDLAGDAVAVWGIFDGTNYLVQSAARPAGGDWSAAQTISALDPGQFHCETCQLPQVGMDATGRAFAIWSRYDSAAGKRKIIMRIRSASGAWGAISTIISSTDPSAGNPQLAVGAAGDAVASWQTSIGGHSVVRAWARPAAGGFVPLQTVSPTDTNAFGAHVGIDSAGNAVAVWNVSPTGLPIDSFMQAAVRPAGLLSTWSSPQPLSAAGAFESQLALNAAGDAVAVWSRTDGSSVIVESAVRPPGAGASWGVVQPVSAPRAGGAFVQEPEVALDPTGVAVAVWRGNDGLNDITKAAVRPAGTGSSWGSPEKLSLAGASASAARVALDSAGKAVAVWDRYPLVQAAVRPAGGSWSPGQDLSEADPSAGDPDVVLDPAGNALVVWTGFVGTNGFVRAAGLDAAGPVFNGLSVPASGTAGVPLSFSVSPFDVWSALGPGPIWNFGDGGSGAGASISHTYSAPGSYTVTLTQADAVGNQSTESSGISIGAAPPPPPPPPATPPKCVVPKVRGRTLAKAKAAIKKGHCRTGKVGRAYSKRVRKGRVLAQKPKAGKRLANGAKVNLVLSRGKRR